MSNIIIYKTEDGETEIEVNLNEETVWLNQKQLSELFDKERSVITKHINNIFKEEELDKKSNVQKMHIAHSDKPILFYNLDVIISVGYRVKSKKGTQFRIWANKIIKEYLIKGYLINEKRLKTHTKQLLELENTVDLLSKSIENNKNIDLKEVKGFLNILTKYTKSFVILNRFDEDRLDNSNLENNIIQNLSYENVLEGIKKLKFQLISINEASEFFGNEKDNSLKGILGNIKQTFDGNHLYPTIEEQAAHLLYFTIKNHPFTDGNKRIGAFLFVWFLQINKFYQDLNGGYKINENTLITLSLLIAQSAPEHKEIMIKLIINLIKT